MEERIYIQGPFFLGNEKCQVCSLVHTSKILSMPIRDCIDLFIWFHCLWKQEQVERNKENKLYTCAILFHILIRCYSLHPKL